MNLAHIVLMPKKSKPEHMSEYRPISLANMVSRMVSKVMANCSKKIPPNVIFDAQSAFVPNRLITNDTIAVFEMLHCMRNRQKWKIGHMVLKLDISKAYNWVEWSFLRQIMLKIGLPVQWMDTAMETVQMATYLIPINGEPRGHITPTSGIKKGDPLSPYLFLLRVEGLSSILRKATETKDLHGITSCRGGNKISHLFFADDSLFFYKATPGECHRLLDILAKYEDASGQAINR